VSDKWGVVAIVAGAGILAYLWLKGKSSSSSIQTTVTGWTSPTGAPGYSQTTTVTGSSPAWEYQISYTSPSNIVGYPTGGGLGDIIAVNKKTGQVINMGGHHIYWT